MSFLKKIATELQIDGYILIIWSVLLELLTKKALLMVMDEIWGHNNNQTVNQKQI